MSSNGIEVCKEWINAGYIEPRSTLNKKINSYGIKHMVEAWAEKYVTNEDFIKAMVDCGYRAQQTSRGSPNFYFNWKYKGAHDWYSVQNK
jgi:hypothetical protein